MQKSAILDPFGLLNLEEYKQEKSKSKSKAKTKRRNSELVEKYALAKPKKAESKKLV